VGFVELKGKTIARRRHFVAKFVYQVVLENAPQMALGLYYTFAVAQTGVTQVGLLSICTSALSTLATIIVVFKHVASRTCKSHGHGQSGVHEHAGCEQELELAPGTVTDTAPGRFGFSVCFTHNISQ
jgi:hypothetical protein